MGHACNSSCSNYFEKQIPDTGVKYTGPAIPALGICTGDYLSEVDAVILQKIFDYAHGIGISMTDPVTGLPTVNLTTGSCAPLFADCISCCGTCTDLPCLLECYRTAICTLYDDVSTIKDEIGPILSGYNTACLTGVNSSSLINLVLQQLITEFCSLLSAFNILDSTVTSFTTGIDTTIGNFLATAITSCSGISGPSVTRTGTGASTQFTFNGFVPVGAIIPYAGPVTNFSGGVGISGTPMCGWNIANGQNGTVNMMGQVPVGRTDIGMGGSLPSNATGLSVTVTGQQVGEPRHTLLQAEIPSLPLGGTLNDQGHDHAFFFNRQQHVDRNGSSVNNAMDATGALVPGVSGNNTGGVAPFVAKTPSDVTAYISRSTTGITLTGAYASGGNGSHNNMQPSTGVLYIQRMF